MDSFGCEDFSVVSETFSVFISKSIAIESSMNPVLILYMKMEKKGYLPTSVITDFRYCKRHVQKGNNFFPVFVVD